MIVGALLIRQTLSFQTIVRERGSAPKGGAHSTVFFAYTASETLENSFFTDNLLMVWQSTPKVAPRSRISRSAAPLVQAHRTETGKGRQTRGRQLAAAAGSRRPATSSATSCAAAASPIWTGGGASRGVLGLGLLSFAEEVFAEPGDDFRPASHIGDVLSNRVLGSLLSLMGASQAG